MNKKLWSIHNWVGLYAGVVIAVLSVTGVLALFKVEIDEAINAKYFKISSVERPTSFHSDVPDLIDSLKCEYGESNFGGISPSLDKSKNWKAHFAVTDGIPFFNTYSYEVFFNPYTAKVVGTRDFFKTFAHYIRHLHVRLFNGLLGRWWVGFAGLALLISTVTGMIIYGGFMKRQFFGAIRNKNLRVKSADYHKVIGMTTLLFNLMIAITGTWLGIQFLIQPILQVKSPKQFKRTEKPISKEEDIAYKVDYIQAFEASRELFPDLDPRYIAYSKDGSRTLTIRGNVPKAAYQNNINYVVLDKEDYRELGRYDIRGKSLGDKAYYAQEGLHYGDFGGIWVKLIYSFFGLTSGVLSILGFVLYLERTKCKQKKKVNYKTTGKKVWIWTFWITAICVLFYVMTATIGRSIPTLIATLAFWGPLLFYLIKFIVLASIKGVKAVIHKTKLVFDGGKSEKITQ